MPGYEVFGDEERKAINDLFDLNGGILFAHGFDVMRKGIFRVREFEQAFSKRMGVPHAQAVSSGSAALKVGLASLEVGKGDEVIVPAFTYIATIEAVFEVGATPVIVDVDDSLNISPVALEAAITKKTRAVIPVHMMGAPVDMDLVMSIASRYSLLVLEDNSQCCGGSYKKQILGTIGDAAAFSFDAGKTIITGEGGMLLTHDENIYKRARAFHDHGHEYNPEVSRGVDAAIMLGFNYRMTELQGAIGIVQLGKLDKIISLQRENKRAIKAAIEGLPLQFRRINDEDGEISDALVFFVETPDLASKFAKRLALEGMVTKNLPDAMNWHFAGRWIHMKSRLPGPDTAWEGRWAASAGLLERSIAIPIMVNMSESRVTETAEKLRRISKDLL